jgi:hypothetical protein
MIIEKIIGSGLEHEFIQFMKLHFNFDEATAKLIINKIQRGEYSIENPEELKKLETEFKKFIKSKFELDFDNPENIENQINARNLAIQNKSSIPAVLSIIITMGFFSCLGYILLNDAEPNDTLLVMLGSLATAWAAVVNYWFGSSSGSAYKNNVIEQMSKR